MLTARVSRGDSITTFGLSDQHYFTPQEASKLIPDIRLKIKELKDRKKMIAALHDEIERYRLLGVRTTVMAEKAALLDSLVEAMTRKITELEDLGLQVKDLDSGLVDFPAERYGEKVLLCWRYGESEVSYWHKPNEGFNGRKPLRVELIQP
jgi:hypothetical protein